MKLVDPSGNVAEVLRLGLVEGVSVRQIARRLHVSRKTVRKILGRHHAPAKPPTPRGSLLDPYEKAIRRAPRRHARDARPSRARAPASARLHRRGHHPARPAAEPAPARSTRGVPDAPLRAGLCRADRLGGLRLRPARSGAPSQRLRRRPLLLPISLYRIHAQPVHGHLPAVHGSLPEVLRGQHGRRHLRQHEDGRPLPHRHRHRLQSQVPRICPRARWLCRGGLQREEG